MDWQIRLTDATQYLETVRNCGDTNDARRAAETIKFLVCVCMYVCITIMGGPVDGMIRVASGTIRPTTEEAKPHYRGVESSLKGSSTTSCHSPCSQSEFILPRLLSIYSPVSRLLHYPLPPITTGGHPIPHLGDVLQPAPEGDEHEQHGRRVEEGHRTGALLEGHGGHHDGHRVQVGHRGGQHDEHVHRGRPVTKGLHSGHVKMTPTDKLRERCRGVNGNAP